MRRGLARCWYRFKNKFRTRSGPGEPLEFLSGSEEELRRVTTWMCHVRLQMFPDNCEAVVIQYGRDAETDQLGGSLISMLKNGDQTFFVPDAEREYSEKWCSWVVRCNAFQGTEWYISDYFFGDRIPRGFAGLPVPGLFEESPLIVQVTVPAPSAHERAEALLSLHEWLDGKVSEEEKRELLQLPNNVKG